MIFSIYMPGPFTLLIGPLSSGADALLIQLLVALACSFVIGFERELKNRPAGLRTHMIVCLASMLVMATGVRFADHAALSGRSVDASRLAAQVVSGIGFLGAGTILKSRGNIHGLTTAATLWAVACIGVAIGAGFAFEAIAVTVTILAALRLVRLFERFTIQRHVIVQLRVNYIGDFKRLSDIEAILSSNRHLVATRRLLAQQKVDGELHTSSLVEIRQRGSANRREATEQLISLLEEFDFILSCEAIGERPTEPHDFDPDFLYENRRTR